MELEAQVSKERIHVGGLGEHVIEADLHKILSSIGSTVQSVDIIRTKGRSFAYIDFVPNSDKALSKLFSTYNGCVWKGGKLRLERAKEDYLTRLRREWAEVAETETQVQSEHHDDVEKSIALPEKPSKNALLSEKKQLQIFFPRLRKMKSLPYSGTGKHKYSFQRIQEPSHPVHFCDCEEHAVVPLHTEKERHATDVMAQNGGVAEEEFDIMNSVMSKLLKRESKSNVMEEDPGVAQEEDQSHESKSDGETDEDNLIMNMVTSTKPTLSESWKHEINLGNKELNFNKRQAPKDWSAEKPRKVQKRDLVTPEKKKQALPTRPVSKEFVSALPEKKEDRQNRSKDSAMLLGAQSSKPELGVQQSTTNHSWSQKKSWKELIGNRDNGSFSVSKILPGIGSAKDNPPQKSSKAKKSDSVVSPKKKRTSVVSKQNNNAEIVSVIPESKGNMLNQSNESEMLLDCQSTEPESSIKQLASGLSQPQKSSSKKFVDGKDSSTDLKVLPSTDSADKEQERPDHLSMSVSTQDKSQKVQSLQGGDGQSGLTQKQEELVDSQPTKQDTGSNNSGRGAAWLHKSSWTQLVRDSNTTFSISQILWGTSFEKQESLETKNVEAANSTGSKHCDLSYQEKTESFIDAHKASETGKASIISAGSSDVPARDMAPSFNVLRSGPKKKLQKITSNQEAPISVPEKECDSTPKATAREDSSVIGETCSFMRSTTSLKEWATTKAALSHFLPEEDDKFLERVRAAVEEEERHKKAAADTTAAKDAIATAEVSRKIIVSHDTKDLTSEEGGNKESKGQLIDSENKLGSNASTGGEPGKQVSEGQNHSRVFNSVASLPIEFYHYYHGSNNDMGTLVEVRRNWDAYIRPGGSRIPGHWVQPPPPADEVWASYLVRPK